MATLLLWDASSSMSSESRQVDAQALSDLVLGYLAEHPEAMETLDGIAEWWIDRRLIRVDVEALASALERLTAQGTLEAIGTGRGRRYRLRSPRPS
jgi:hypothetical protein